MCAEMGSERTCLPGLTRTEETRSTVATASHQQSRFHPREHLALTALFFGHVQLQWYVPIATLTRASSYVISLRALLASSMDQLLLRISPIILQAFLGRVSRYYFSYFSILRPMTSRFDQVSFLPLNITRVLFEVRLHRLQYR